jgi:hypothetical protein
MKQFTITFYSDPGHGWGKVKRHVLHKLGIINSISAYSYQKDDNVFLEEDCDLPVLCQALNMAGYTIVFKDKRSNTDSRIRSYERFTIQPNEQLALELA